MKKKTMAFVMSLLMIVALVGVGFATWIITADTKEEATGNITVDTVVDTRIGITAEWTTDEGLTEGAKTSIVFGAPETSNAGWLQNDSAEKENLTMYLKLTITNLYQKVDKTEYKLDNTDGIKFVLSAVGEKYAAALASNYVAALPEIKALYLCKASSDQKLFLSTDKSDVEYNAGTDVEILDGGATVIIPVTFEWGTKFGETSTNPYDYYNGKGIDDPADWTDSTENGQYDEGEEIIETYGDEAVRVLKDLNKLNAEQFKIVITAKSVSEVVE